MIALGSSAAILATGIAVVFRSDRVRGEEYDVLGLRHASDAETGIWCGLLACAGALLTLLAAWRPQHLRLLKASFIVGILNLALFLPHHLLIVHLHITQDAVGLGSGAHTGQYQLLVIGETFSMLFCIADWVVTLGCCVIVGINSRRSFGGGCCQC